jgi:hypothetical protein
MKLLGEQIHIPVRAVNHNKPRARYFVIIYHPCFNMVYDALQPVPKTVYQIIKWQIWVAQQGVGQFSYQHV